VARHSNDGVGNRHRRAGDLKLWAIRIPDTIERSLLVSGLWHSDGDGLALLWYYDLGAGRPEAGNESAFLGPWFDDLWWPWSSSVRAPDELRAFSQKTGLDGDMLARTSRLTARIDNNAVADGFQLYLHSFVITQSGEWAVVQQGMNSDSRLARRYHWHSASVRDFVSAPHTAIVGQPQGEILNLVDARAKKAQRALLTIAKGPE
jgi:Protein of unknown function (DUF763)